LTKKEICFQKIFLARKEHLERKYYYSICGFFTFNRIDQNKMNFQILVIFCFSCIVGEAFTLECYQCSAHKGASCRSNDRQTCQEPNSVCLTQTYKYQFGKEEKTRFIKRCADGKEKCENNCKYVGRRSYDCKVSCCSSNFCNEEVDSKVIWYALLRSSGGSVIKSGMKILNLLISTLPVLLASLIQFY
uniref:UPAR/Ly6 domain-containing protein n=1 Tax=Clytia hemisphaerica TaxID=252671 RepID=A0A7M5URS5_9CNID